MIQLNLLPDVKLEYIKAQKMRSLTTGVSVVVTAVALVILLLLLVFDFAQKSKINSNKSTILSQSSELKNKPNINTILTVQNQLAGLNSLYAQRPEVYKLFSNYLSEVTPEAVSLNQMLLNFQGNTVVLDGTTDTLVTINKFVDTLKLTDYSINNSKALTPAFTNIVLSSFGVSSQATDPSRAASFTINMDFAPAIFNSAESASLTVPNIIVTHSEQSDTGSLFSSSSPSSTSGGSN